MPSAPVLPSRDIFRRSNRSNNGIVASESGNNIIIFDYYVIFNEFINSKIFYDYLTIIN